jgi:hypothetical protein
LCNPPVRFSPRSKQVLTTLNQLYSKPTYDAAADEVQGNIDLLGTREFCAEMGVIAAAKIQEINARVERLYRQSR